MAMPRATHLLSLLIQLCSVAAYTFHGHPDQAAALLQLKQSFIFDYSTTTLPSWEPGTDCCLWEGVGCDEDVSGSGQVTVLDLGGCGLYSYGFHAALFNLTSLRYLDLSMNDFGGSRIPAAGFERLSKLTHLNLSCSGLYGQIPVAISKLTSLVKLDLSSEKNIGDSYRSMSRCDALGARNDLVLQEPSFKTLVADLTNLRELYLDGMDISSSGQGWCSGLGKAVPSLQVLSMSFCELYGPIHSSLASLQSLTVINLEHNVGISGVVPEFFADYVNLSLLQLRSNHFSGWFPQKIFQLKNIRVLDVSGNSDLSGHLPEFTNGTSLETLNLQFTNFTGVSLSSFSKLLSLKGLGIDGGLMSMKPPELFFNQLNSLQNLQLSFEKFSGELGPFFSWISNLKNLTSLTLNGYRSNTVFPPSIDNLTNLASLEIADWDILGQIPPSIGNLTKLTSLTIFRCAFSGTIPSSVGNLKKLRSLGISNSGLTGPITRDIEHLSELRVLALTGCGLSGRIPNIFVNLTQLTYVDLSYNDLTGEIPTSLFTSPRMLRMDLSSNQLSGPIPELGQLTNLVDLILRSNQISGPLPELGGLTSLVDLDLNSNNLGGLLQLSSLMKLRKLMFLGLSNNRLSVLDGEDGKSTVPLLPKLTSFELESCNMTNIPRFLMHVNHIEILDLSNNKIHGTIPKWIWDTFDDRLTRLNLSHNMFTHMQLTTYVLPNIHLQYLDLSFNKLQGKIPMPNLLATYRNSPQVLDFSNNNFSLLMSNFTSYLSQTTYLILSKNNISGHIPDSICDARHLEVLDLSYNNFTGVIPSCLIEDIRLGVLNLRENSFEGTLPDNINQYCSLQRVDLHNNKFQGQLPRSLSNCTYFEVLDIGNNQIVDTFPSWLGRLSNLRVLVLRSNQFYGSLGHSHRDVISGEYFSKLQILDIASNYISGNLDPRWFERFTSMVAKFNDTVNILGHEIPYGASYYNYIVAITYKGQYVTIEKILTALTVIDFSNMQLMATFPSHLEC